MNRDIRLYYYEAGGLKKWSNYKNQYYFDSIEQAKDFGQRINTRLKTEYQWVITEYFYGRYNSKIIEVI